MSTTPINTPSVDQQVQYISTETSAPLTATIVNIWADGAVDVVITDKSLPSNRLVKRMPYVPYGGTPTYFVPGDTRYVTQLPSGDGLPAVALQSTAATVGGAVDAGGPSTEPLEN